MSERSQPGTGGLPRSIKPNQTQSNPIKPKIWEGQELRVLIRTAAANRVEACGRAGRKRPTWLFLSSRTGHRAASGRRAHDRTERNCARSAGGGALKGHEHWQFRAALYSQRAAPKAFGRLSDPAALRRIVVAGSGKAPPRGPGSMKFMAQSPTIVYARADCEQFLLHPV
jgi:hypothetical protein